MGGGLQPTSRVVNLSMCSLHDNLHLGAPSSVDELRVEVRRMRDSQGAAAEGPAWLPVSTPRAFRLWTHLHCGLCGTEFGFPSTSYILCKYKGHGPILINDFCKENVDVGCSRSMRASSLMLVCKKAGQNLNNLFNKIVHHFSFRLFKASIKFDPNVFVKSAQTKGHQMLLVQIFHLWGTMVSIFFAWPLPLVSRPDIVDTERPVFTSNHFLIEAINENPFPWKERGISN